MTSHWGEFSSPHDVDPDVASSEREQMLVLRPMDIEGPRLHQPSSRHYPPTNEQLPAEKFQIDPVVQHTILLLQHARRLRILINNIQQQDKAIDYEAIYPDAPPIPQYNGPTPITIKQQNTLPFMEKQMDSDFVKGIGEPPAKIDDSTCRHLLRRSVTALLAHAGYDVCAESMLETLTDLTNEFLLQFTRHLRVASDNLSQHEPTGFPDIMQQVFEEMGSGSVTGLHEFYHKRVINYHGNMEDTCVQLDSEYEKLKEPILQQKQQPDTLSVIRIKEEPSEIHFPELDEIDDVNGAEQLLNLNDLGGFEITVEHESASGLTTEVESKWSQIKAESVEAKMVGLEQFEDGGSSNPVKNEPRSLSPSSPDDSITDPPSINVSDILSPNSVLGKAKKNPIVVPIK